MSYRFTRLWARLMVVIGILFIVLGVALGLIALFTEEWRPGVTGAQVALERAVLVGGLVISGFLAGSPFIVFGQLIEIFLDQRRLLRRIERRLRRATPPPPPKPGDQYPKLAG
jgi:uncharacterized membrane protein